MINLSKDQRQAVDMVMTGNNVFVTGGAGSGKSIFINAVRHKLKQNGKNVVVCAPTGKASLNVKGVTIHRLFRLSIATGSNVAPLNDKDRLLLSSIDTVIIDEISMVRSDIFNMIDKRLREALGVNIVFGGKQVVVVGDYYQLPPVVRKEQEMTYLHLNFGGVFPFTTSSWHEAHLHAIELTTNHRQGDSAEFTHFLNRIRIGDCCTNNLIGNLNHRTQITQRPLQDVTAICTTNNLANTINLTRLNELSTPLCRFVGQIKGYFPMEELPTEVNLDLKVGAHVVLLKNETTNGEFTYSNGSMGSIVCFVNGGVVVKLDGSSRIVTVKEHIWESYDYDLTINGQGKVEIEETITGTFSQLPVKLGYAMTIHSVQGASMDKVHVVLGHYRLQPGQLYVALSRCRSLDGLTYDREIEFNDIVADPSVAVFMNSIKL